jgi:hypothetical protein
MKRFVLTLCATASFVYADGIVINPPSAAISALSTTQAQHSAWIASSTGWVNDISTKTNFANLRIDGSLIPNASNTLELGSLSRPWKDLYLGSNSIYLGGVKAITMSNDSLRVDDLTVAGNLIAHGTLAMGYLVCSNNTNEIVWSGPFSRTTTLTNLYWCSSVGAATGTVFIANNATALSAWDSICYTGIACDVTTPSNAPVAIEVTAGQRLGTMVSASTNYTLAVQW